MSNYTNFFPKASQKLAQNYKTVRCGCVCIRRLDSEELTTVVKLCPTTRTELHTLRSTDEIGIMRALVTKETANDGLQL